MLGTRSLARTTLAGWGRPALPIAVVSVLLYLGLANIAARATWREAEDGVLWQMSDDGVVAAEVADASPASDTGLQAGDVLLAIDDRPIQRVVDVLDALHASGAGASVRYTVLRLGTREVVDVRVAPAASGSRNLYFLLASVGVFTLLIGGAVRLRRPRDAATLHFFWLAVAFFGVFTFSFSGRFDRLDWVFYWGDVASILLLPPLFLHFVLEFPERSRRWKWGAAGRIGIAAIYLPALVLGAARVVTLLRSGLEGVEFARVVGRIDRLELAYLAVCFVGAVIALTRALADIRSLTGRRQLRWIAWGTALGTVPFAFGYALPYALGVEPSLPMSLSAIPLGFIPLAYASAIVRYRLMDVEVIIKRALVYIAVAGVVVGIYVVLLQTLEGIPLSPGAGTGHRWVIAVLVMLMALVLAPPVKNVIENALDRAFYRDRYDYRRALGAFARDLNSDLDLNRLSERLVARVGETLLLDHLSLMIEDESAPQFASVRAKGFGEEGPPPIAKPSTIGVRLAQGHRVVLDDPIASSRFPIEEVEFWRDAGLYYFVPCVAAPGTIAVLALGRKNGSEPLSSEDMTLLAAVTGQMATALENARLYRQLHLKADELDRLRSFNENILESLHDGLLVVDLDDRIVRWNKALEPLYGLSPSAAIGRRMSDVFAPAFVDAILSGRREQPDGATLSRLQMPGKDGARIVDAAVVPLRAPTGGDVTTIGTIVIIEDVTRRVQLEEQLQISEKMASIGLLAAGVAHEVNTPLTGISSFTQMLLEGADPQDPRTQLLEKIERQTFRAARIVNGLLNLSRPSSAEAAEAALVDINVVIGDVLALLEHQFQLHHLKVRRELAEAPLFVSGFEHKLQQVFLNLFLNAKDAMPRGGWLSVSTHPQGARVVAEVSDTGSGIPNEHLTRIYDPFFTTKAIGQGTGLGLSITYGIVREHEGSIDCESAVGQGTHFTLDFPAAPSSGRARLAGRR